MQLSERAICLLKSACLHTPPAFEENKKNNKLAAQELKTFLALPRAQLAPAWKAAFGMFPPRGTLARIANRLEVDLHATSQPFGWPTPHAFRQEIRRVRRWYRKGKKSWRKNHSLPRAEGAPEFVRGLQTCWTQKVNLHYRRLLGRIRQEGLWSWRQMSRAMRLARLGQQTGTVSVERVWSYCQAEFPTANRSMSLEYFSVMSALLFLRFNLQHFKAKQLPGWLENDSLLATKLDAILAWARSQGTESDLHDFASAFD